jgi:hypothetical protein
MVENNAFARVNLRMWSDTASLRPVAARLGLARFLYDKGDIVPPPRTGVKARRAPRNYLSSTEVVADLPAVRGQVAQFVRTLDADSLLRRLTEDRTIDAVVWVAIFGDQGAASIEDLKIDVRPFGARLGLVVENYADFDKTGNPRKLLIGPAASGKTAV